MARGQGDGGGAGSSRRRSGHEPAASRLGDAAPAPVVPALLCGGSGGRLWPLSRAEIPKQFLALDGGLTPFQQAVRLVSGVPGFAPAMVLAGARHRALAERQLDAVAAHKPLIVLEPFGRDTGAAAAAAALLAVARDPDALLLLLPTDQHIADRDCFLQTMDLGVEAARGGALVLFGVVPDRPAAGYGYIRAGAPLRGSRAVRRVAEFVEKPDRRTAESYLAGGKHLWNSGIFLLSARSLLEEFECFAPDILHAMREAVAGAARDGPCLRLGAQGFARCPPLSMDRAIMERTRRAAVVQARFGWRDLGTWGALWQCGKKDAAGTVSVGQVRSRGVRDSYLRSEGPLLAAMDVEGVIVVATSDAVLVIGKSADEQLKELAHDLKDAAQEEGATPAQRAGGSFRTLHEDGGVSIRRLAVAPGASLGRRMQRGCLKHWIVISGIAHVTRDEERIVLKVSESILLPANCAHSLDNPGPDPLLLIEIQICACAEDNSAT